MQAYRAEDYPTIMDPLVLATMLGDVARLAWMVFRWVGGWVGGANSLTSDVASLARMVLIWVVLQSPSCAVHSVYVFLL